MQSVCAIKDKDVLSKLEGISLFGLGSDYTRVNNILAIVYIAHKIRVEFLWQRFLNSIIPKFFLKSIYKQYLFHAKVEYMSFEEIQEIIPKDNHRAKGG